MKRGLLLLLGFFLCAQMLIGTVSAQMDTVPKLDIHGVKKVKIDRNISGYGANMLLSLRNSSDMNVRVRNFKFTVEFELGEATGSPNPEGEGDKEKSRSDVKVVPFGKGEIADVTLPKATEQPTLKDLDVRVAIGPENEETAGRIVEFANIIGDPADNVKVVLKGEGEVGRELNREGGGWIYQKGIIIELKLTPTLQREWLLK